MARNIHASLKGNIWLIILALHSILIFREFQSSVANNLSSNYTVVIESRFPRLSFSEIRI